MRRAAPSLTGGPILASLLRFALPMLVGNLLQQVYTITDTLIVGRWVGQDALAAVGSAYTLMTFLTSVIIGLCMGSASLLSVRHGAGDVSGFRQDCWLSMLFLFPVTLIMIALTLLLTDPLLRLMQVPEAPFTLMRGYVRILFPGMLFTAVYNLEAYKLRSAGDSAAPMAVLAASTVLNIVLDLIFVAGLSLGVDGAASATLISQGCAAAGIVLYGFTARPQLRLCRSDCRMDRGRLLQIIANDTATALQQSVMNFGILMIQGLVNTFGVTVMAAFTVGVKVDTLAYMPAQEFGNAYSIFVSQNFGAHLPDRVRKGTRLAVIASGTFCAVISLAVFAAAPLLIGAFVEHPEASLLAAGVHYLRIEGVFYAGIGILFLLYGYYRGIQRPAFSLLLTVISLGTRVLLAYLLAPNTPLGVTAIWAAIPIGWILADATGLVLMNKVSPKQ